MKKFTALLLLILGWASTGFSQSSCIDDGTRYNVYNALTDRNWGFWMPDFYGPGTGIAHFSFQVEGYETFLDVYDNGTVHLHGVVAHDNRPLDHNGELWGIDVWFDANPDGTPKNSADPIPVEVMETWDLYILRDGSKMWSLSDPSTEAHMLSKEDFPFGFQIGELASLYNHLCDGCYTLGASTWLDFVNQWNGKDNRMSGAVHMTLNECVPDECEIGHRTQTPGGWGAEPQGENPGTYLHANFDNAFPNGLVVGCDHTITFTSAQAITDFLPSGGKPGAITTSYTDPTNKINVLAGHVTALSLSIGFDSYDSNFGSSSTSLSNLVANGGAFNGWTAGDILNEANRVLGGCNSPYSASQLADALALINENFVDGMITGDYLQCEGEGTSVEPLAYPNPFENELTLVLSNLEGQDFDYKVINSYGELKLTGTGSVNNNGNSKIDLSTLENGSYIISVITNKSVKSIHIIKN